MFKASNNLESLKPCLSLFIDLHRFLTCFCYSFRICPKLKHQTIKMHIIKSQTAFSFTSSHICSEWKLFNELLPVLKNRGTSLLSRKP